MVQKVIWSPEALHTFIQIISYLNENWTHKEVEKFADRVDEKLALLSLNPRLGSIKSKKANTHKTVIHKKVLLIYKYKPLKKEIILLNFWNTQQNPAKLK
jgi:plasmid stabilization system protein ParE